MKNYYDADMKEILEEAKIMINYRDKEEKDKYMLHGKYVEDLIHEYIGDYEVDNSDLKKLELWELLEASLEEIKQIDISKDAGNMLRAGIHSKRATSLIEECISRVPNKKVG